MAPYFFDFIATSLDTGYRMAYTDSGSYEREERERENRMPILSERDAEIAHLNFIGRHLRIARDMETDSLTIARYNVMIAAWNNRLNALTLGR